MAVSSVNRSKGDEVRQTRDEYEEREENLVRRKNEELKRAERRHQAELQKLKEDFQKQVETIKSHNQETITERDVRNNQKIDKMRSVYAGQLRKKMEDSQMERTALRDAYESRIESDKAIGSRQRAHLEEKQMQELEAKDKQFKEVAQKTQERLRSAIDENRSNLTEAHGKEKNVLIQNRDEVKTQGEMDKKVLKDYFKTESARQKRDLTNKSEYWKSRYDNEVAQNDADTNESLKLKNETLKLAVTRSGEKFQNRIQQKEDQINETNEQFKDQVNERVNDQVRARSQEIQRLRNQISTNKVNSERQKELEKGHLRDTYEEQLAITERQKRDMKDEFLGLAQDRTSKVLRRQEDTMREAQRNYKSQMNLVSTKSKEDNKALRDQHEASLEYIKARADKRVDKINQVRTENEERLQNHYHESVNVLRDDYRDKVTTQRDENLNNVSKLNLTMAKRFRGMENSFQQKLDYATTTFDNKVNQMREEHAKEMRRIESMYQDRINQRDKGHKLEKESLEQKYENKIALIQEQNDEKIQKMTKRHEEDLKAIAQKTNYSRKA